MSAIVHPDYDSITTNNDIALLKLAEAVDLSIHTPACLPASTADYVGQTAKVYGEKILQNAAFQPFKGRLLYIHPPSCESVVTFCYHQFYFQKNSNEGQKSYIYIYFGGKLIWTTRC